MGATKYTLKSQSKDGQQVCAFFSLPQGCKNGANCAFVHDASGSADAEQHQRQQQQQQPAAPATPAPVTKSIQAMRQVKEEIAREQAEAPARKRPRASEDASPFTAQQPRQPQQQPQQPAAQQQPQRKKRRQQKEASQRQATAAAVPHDDPFAVVAAPPKAAAPPRAAAPKLPPAPAAAANNNRKPAAALSGANGAAAAAANASTNGGAMGRKGAGAGLMAKLAGLPITPFSVPRAANTTPSPEPTQAEEGEIEEGKIEEEEPAAALALVPPPPVEEHGGHRWHGCVETTLAHARFEGDYRVVLESQKGVGDWVEPRPHGPWCKDLPHVVAVDCEMCATRDPVSLEQDGKALIRLSVVSGHDEQDVLLDSLVLPSLPVVDYRSDIHGITPQALRDVRFTFRHAQAAMLQLCCSETVVVGHGLCNDLAALRMRHRRVVDTALLFQRQDAPHHTPALKDVARAVLGHDLPDAHDSVADAQATLRVARHFLEQGPTAPVPRLPGPAGGKKARRGETLASCLLLHRLPGFVTAEHLAQMFADRTHVKPVSVDPVASVAAAGGGGLKGASGRTTARFLSKAHADLAFATLTGPARPDKDGRPQKRVYLANKREYVQVRLMYTEAEEKAAAEEEGPTGGGEEQEAASLEKLF